MDWGKTTKSGQMLCNAHNSHPVWLTLDYSAYECCRERNCRAVGCHVALWECQNPNGNLLPGITANSRRAACTKQELTFLLAQLTLWSARQADKKSSAHLGHLVHSFTRILRQCLFIHLFVVCLWYLHISAKKKVSSGGRVNNGWVVSRWAPPTRQRESTRWSQSCLIAFDFKKLFLKSYNERLNGRSGGIKTAPKYKTSGRQKA